MRLINVHTLKLEEFFDDSQPEYAILSHRWGKDEVTYQEMIDLQPATRQRDAFRKIQQCCRKAIKHGLYHIWVDTCCIDKTSSAELSEAINSMYRWYKESSICFAYLSDVTCNTSVLRHNSLLEKLSQPDCSDTDDDFNTVTSLDDPDDFVRSTWFTRGWTLQELIAPARVIFFNSNWHKLGTKHTLTWWVMKATGIGEDYIVGMHYVWNASIAKRMSWASNRKTSRVEDMAYCLMGIFGVNMPMIYGEGDRAFIRLQEEILKTSNDHSIFAWTLPKTSLKAKSGLLASHPRAFLNSAGFLPFSGLGQNSLLVTSTNLGVSLEVYLERDFHDHMSVCLNCNEEGDMDRFAIIELKAVDRSKSQYIRANYETLRRGRISGVTRRIYVGHSGRNALNPQPSGQNWFSIGVFSHRIHWRLEVCPGTRWREFDSSSGKLGDARAMLSSQGFRQEDCARLVFSYPLYTDSPAVIVYGVGETMGGAGFGLVLKIIKEEDGSLIASLEKEQTSGIRPAFVTDHGLQFDLDHWQSFEQSNDLEPLARMEIDYNRRRNPYLDGSDVMDIKVLIKDDVSNV